MEDESFFPPRHLVGLGPRGRSPGRAPSQRAVVIYADDLGYGDLSAQGNKDFATPNIDSLAQHGVKCTDGYVTAPLCSPSRAGMLSGQYQQRFGAEVNPAHGKTPTPRKANRGGMPAGVVTFAERMKAQGYTTGCVGKWHLGFTPEQHPMKQGFDEFFGFIAGARGYVQGKANQNMNYIFRGYEQVKELTYTTDMFGARGRRLREETRRPAVVSVSRLQRRAHPDAGEKRGQGTFSRDQGRAAATACRHGHAHGQKRGPCRLRPCARPGSWMSRSSSSPATTAGPRW